MNSPRLFAVLSAFLFVADVGRTADAGKPTRREISRTELKDKIAGYWIGM